MLPRPPYPSLIRPLLGASVARISADADLPRVCERFDHSGHHPQSHAGATSMTLDVPIIGLGLHNPSGPGRQL